MVWLVATGLLMASACAGKTERGIGNEAIAETRSAGPAGASDATTPEASTPEVRRHVLMLVELELTRQVAKTLKARSVDLPLPRKRGPAQKGPWQVDVLDAAGAVLYTAPLPDSSTLRGEFENEAGQLSSVHTQQQVAAVTLRLPLLKDAARVRVSKLGATKGMSELGSVAYPKVQQ